jgi:Tol biopolymer transport system component
LISLINCCSNKDEAEFIKLFKRNHWRLIVEGRKEYQEFLADYKKFRPIQKTSEFGKARPDFFSLGNFDISPDGTKIVFIIKNFKEPNEIILVDNNFERPDILIKMQNASNPVWSNDGSKIAFTGIPDSIDKNDLSKASLFLYEMDSKKLTTLVKGYVLDFSGYDKNISWHPDNRTIFLPVAMIS